MTDIEQEVREAMAADPNYPLGERDALKWAVAFRLTATMANPLGRALRAFPNMDQGQLVDIMIGWFAYAMASADPKFLMAEAPVVGEGVHPDVQGRNCGPQAGADGRNLDIGLAVLAARAGKRVSREGWNGSGQFVYLVPAASYPVQTGAAKAHFGEGSMVPYREYLALKTAQGDVATWSPSVSDTLASDWFMLPDGANEHGIGPDTAVGCNPNYDPSNGQYPVADYARERALELAVGRPQFSGSTAEEVVAAATVFARYIVGASA